MRVLDERFGILRSQHVDEMAAATRQDPVVLLNDLRPLGADYETLATRLAGRPGIKAVSVADIPPWGTLANTLQIALTADAAGGKTINEAAALEQAKDLLATREEEAQQAREPRAAGLARQLRRPTRLSTLASRSTWARSFELGCVPAGTTRMKA